MGVKITAHLENQVEFWFSEREYPKKLFESTPKSYICKKRVLLSQDLLLFLNLLAPACDQDECKILENTKPLLLLVWFSDHLHEET